MAGPGRGALRSYVKLDTDVLFSEEFARLPSVAIAAFLMVWSWAARQPQRGYFKSERVLREYLGPTHSRGIAALYAAGLLFRTPDRRVEAVGYAEMHEEDAELPSRMRRLRARRKAVLEALDPSSGEQDTSTFTRNDGNAGSSAFNRNERAPSTQNPVPVTQKTDRLRVGPSANDAGVNGHNPQNDDSTEAGAVAWLTRFFGQPPTAAQMDRVREVAERAELRKRRDLSGWAWVLEKFEVRPKLIDRSDGMREDPLEYLFRKDTDWQKRELKEATQ